jgi:tRNA 2-selenouridine synthase
VVSQLEELPSQFKFIVIHGPTGSGKSRLLAALGNARAQVLDLEGLAAHRGSVLGNLPGQPQPTQKMFESRLLDALRRLDAARPVFVEGESRKIGQLHVPDALIERMRAAECVRLDTSIETRVTLLLEEYRHFVADRSALDAQLDCLTALHGRERIAAWKALAAAQDWRQFVSRLLLEHYDPAYRKSSTHNFVRLADARTVRIASPEETAFAKAAEDLLKPLKAAA